MLPSDCAVAAMVRVRSTRSPLRGYRVEVKDGVAVEVVMLDGTGFSFDFRGLFMFETNKYLNNKEA